MSDHEKTRTKQDRPTPQAAPEGLEDALTGDQQEADTGPEIDGAGSDPESNVTGRSKPSSDGVAQHDSDEAKANP